MSREIRIIRNPTYEKDYDYAFKYNRWLFHLILVSPSKNYSRLKVKIFNSLYEVIYVALMLSMIVSSLLGTFRYCINSIEMFKSLFLILIFSGNMIKYVVLAKQYKSIYTCIQSLDFDWKYIVDGSRGVMMKYAKTNRTLFQVVFFVVTTAVLFWQFAALFQKPVVVDNVAYYDPPFISDYVYFDARVKPYYYFACFLQLIQQLTNVIIYALTCQSISFILHICGQFEILSATINDLRIGHPETIEKTKRILTLILKKQNMAMRSTDENRIDIP